MEVALGLTTVDTVMLALEGTVKFAPEGVIVVTAITLIVTGCDLVHSLSLLLINKAL